MSIDSSTTTSNRAPTARTATDTVMENITTTHATTTLPTEACVVTNETKEGVIIDVRPTMHGSDREVIISTQWRSDANVSKIEVTLDGDRLFEVQSSVLTGETVSGFGRPVGIAPLAGRLHVELHDDGRRSHCTTRPSSVSGDSPF